MIDYSEQAEEILNQFNNKTNLEMWKQNLRGRLLNILKTCPLKMLIIFCLIAGAEYMPKIVKDNQR